MIWRFYRIHVLMTLDRITRLITSKLDTLSKEDLIKFTKKQMVVLQKVKARCADLEQEVEKLKKKSSGGADEAIIQELTERMDAVLLEKAETQQRLVLLRKENEKAKQEAKDALDKVTELQKQFDLSNVEHLKKIEDVKHELETVHSKHKEEAADFQKLLQESSKKEQMLTAQFRQQLGHQNEVKELEEQFKLVRQKYEDQLSSLQQQLISSEEERRRETTMLKEIQEAAIAECQKEIESLRGELLKIRIAHQEEVKELVDQLESAALEHEQERYRLLQMNEDLTEQLDQKENSLQDVEEEEETGIEWVKKHSEPLVSVEQGEDEVINLKRMLKDLQSQHSILQDELTYLSNVKTGLELELQQAKDEFLHEKEELEFNINELQLCKEDNDSIATKCKSDLQTTNDHWEMALNQHEQELQALKQRHQKEIVALEQTLLSTAEKEKGKVLLEIQNLKEECEKLSVEKDEAVDSYEKTMEILRNVQSELGDTTGHFVKQYNAMKESNAAEIHELQQKLRVAFNEKDKLLERINNLESEARPQQDTSESDWENKKQELLSILHHKDTALRELEEKLAALNLEKDDMLAALKHSEVEVEKLRDACSTEQAQCVEFQQNLTKDKTQIKALEEELMNLKKERDHLQEKLHLVRSDRDSLSKFNDEIRDLEKSSQAVSEEKERLRKDLEEKQQQLTDFQHRLEYLAKDNTQLQQRLDEAEIQTGANAAEKESISHQLEILENKVAALCLEKEQKCSDLKALEEDLTNLKKERDETGNLEKSFQAVSEEKERLRKDLEEKQQQLAEVRVHVFNYLQQEAGIEVFANNDQEVEDISVLVQKLWDKVMEGKRSALLQSDEQIAQLQDDIESLREDGRLQEVELRSFNDDLSKERTLLKENLEEVLSDKEGLQRDLLEMKNRNEKMRVENEALLAQIEAVSEKLKEIEKEKNDEIDQTVQQVVGDDEREKLLRLLAEKESELSNLQGEIVSLQESKQNSSTAEEVIRELTDKIGNLEKEHKEKHEKMNKIKAVAVKAKKELDTTRKEVQALKEELELVKTERERLSGSVKDVIQAAESYKNLLAEYDKQTEQLDLEKERGDNCDRQIGELTKHLQAAVLQKDQLISEKEDQLTCLETLQMNVKQLEAQIVELQKGKSAVEKELEGEKLLKEHKIKDHSMSLKEIEDLQRHLQKQNQQLQQAVQELELLRKDAQQSSLMDMEMADYERLVKELNQNISDKESRIEEYEGEIKIQKQRQETLQEEISSMKSCLDQTEDKNTKIKQLLVKTKKELADTKKSEANQLAIQSSLKGELEANQQQLEDYKIQCADLTAERHKLQEQLRFLSDQLQRAKSAFQQKIATLQEECTAAKAEQVSTASEFESYKVRVHNVLKQQKNKSASQNEKDAATQERECMERMMDQLKAKLQETQHSLQANMNELQALQSEHDTLLERHNKMLQETVAKEAELGDKLRSIQSENMVLKSEHAQTLSHLTDQNEALRNSFREQVRHLQEDHRKTVETLQQQVSKVEAQLFQLQKEASTTSPVPVQQTRKILQERKNADLLLFDLQSMAREEGEGMETTETESVSSSGTHIPSLELLLNSPEPKMEPLVWQAEPTKEELAQELNTATKSIEHMNGLLYDTEATNAILMEQITLLKSEVRRLERNQEREKSVANLEYLKNVLLQFIFLKSGSERQALLPVIHTMLQLSPEERSKLSAIAQGEEEAVVASRSSGWTSYLHSWSGIR